MNTQRATHHAPALRFEELNWVASTPLPRDREQSNRLHEPDHLINTIDPISGNDITDFIQQPHLKDGNLTIYFESEQTMREFLNMQVNHPYEHALGTVPDDADRGG